MTSDHMHVLVDRNNVDSISPRVIREAEFLLLDSFDVGMQAWDFLRTQEHDLWNDSKSLFRKCLKHNIIKLLPIWLALADIKFVINSQFEKRNNQLLLFHRKDS